MKVKYIGSGALLIASLVFVDFIIQITSFPSWPETAFSYVSLCLFPIGFLLIVIGLARDAKPSVEVPCEPEADLVEFAVFQDIVFNNGKIFPGKVVDPVTDIEFMGIPGNIYYTPSNRLDEE